MLFRSEYFGQFGSRWNDLKSAWVPNEDAAAMRMKIESLIDTVYAGAGKQLSDTEIAMVKKAWIPDGQKPIENINAALGVMKTVMERKLRVLNHNIDKAGYIRDFSKWSASDYLDTTSPLSGWNPSPANNPVEPTSRSILEGQQSQKDKMAFIKGY